MLSIKWIIIALFSAIALPYFFNFSRVLITVLASVYHSVSVSMLLCIVSYDFLYYADALIIRESSSCQEAKSLFVFIFSGFEVSLSETSELVIPKTSIAKVNNIASITVITAVTASLAKKYNATKYCNNYTHVIYSPFFLFSAY